MCGRYHLLQSCFSFFLRLHGQPEPLGSYHLLQSCFSFFVHLHGQPVPFGSCLKSYFSLQSIFINSLQSFESGQVLFLMVFCFLFALSFSRLILSLSFLCSSVSEALFALSSSFLNECCFFFVHAKVVLAYSRMNNTGVTGQF